MIGSPGAVMSSHQDAYLCTITISSLLPQSSASDWSTGNHMIGVLGSDWLKMILVCYATSKRPLLSKDTMKNVLQKSTLQQKGSLTIKYALPRWSYLLNFQTFAIYRMLQIFAKSLTGNRKRMWLWCCVLILMKTCFIASYWEILHPRLCVDDLW